MEGCVGGRVSSTWIKYSIVEGGAGGKGDNSIFGLMQVEFEMGAWIVIEVAHVTGPSSSR